MLFFFVNAICILRSASRPFGFDIMILANFCILLFVVSAELFSSMAAVPSAMNSSFRAEGNGHCSICNQRNYSFLSCALGVIRATMSSSSFMNCVLQRSRRGMLLHEDPTGFRKGGDIEEILSWSEDIWRAVHVALGGSSGKIHSEALFGARMLALFLRAPVRYLTSGNAKEKSQFDVVPVFLAILDDIELLPLLVSQLGLMGQEASLVWDLKEGVGRCRRFLVPIEKSAPDDPVCEGLASSSSFERKIAATRRDAWGVLATEFRSCLRDKLSLEHLCVSLVRRLTEHVVIVGDSSVQAPPSCTHESFNGNGLRRKGTRYILCEDKVCRRFCTRPRARHESIRGAIGGPRDASILRKQPPRWHAIPSRRRLGVSWLRQLHQQKNTSPPAIVPSAVCGLDKAAAALWVVAMLVSKRQPGTRTACRLPHPAFLRGELAALKRRWAAACGDSMHDVNYLLSGSESGKHEVASIIYSKHAMGGFSVPSGSTVLKRDRLFALANSLVGLSVPSSFEKVRQCCQDMKLFAV